MATACAAEEGLFWQMHDRLFENQRQLEPWGPHAEAVGLDVGEFEECLASGRHDAAVRRDMAQAAKAGATGTPAFLLARTDPDGDLSKVKGLSTLRGALPFSRFKTALDEALAEIAESSPEPAATD